MQFAEGSFAQIPSNLDKKIEFKDRFSKSLVQSLKLGTPILKSKRDLMLANCEGKTPIGSRSFVNLPFNEGQEYDECNFSEGFDHTRKKEPSFHKEYIGIYNDINDMQENHLLKKQ